jgi:hypothetical protein
MSTFSDDTLRVAALLPGIAPRCRLRQYHCATHQAESEL